MDRRSKGRPESQGSLPPISSRRSMFPPSSSPHPNAGGGANGGVTGSPFATPGTEAWRFQQQPQYQATATGVDLEKGDVQCAKY